MAEQGWIQAPSNRLRVGLSALVWYAAQRKETLIDPGHRAGVDSRGSRVFWRPLAGVCLIGSLVCFAAATRQRDGQDGQPHPGETQSSSHHVSADCFVRH